MAKKLQVFVSSTYDDMKDERQAVVEAILRAGHIPAGMELFAAGSESQLETIKKWIADSDVFMLILGGRYGTIDEESGKSYIQLEYEFAIETDIPFFAVVMHDEYLDQKVAKDGRGVLEQKHPDLLDQFKTTVKERICRLFKDIGDLKLAVFESLLDIERNRNPIGWVRADSVANPTPLIEQIGQLQKENGELRKQLGDVDSAEQYNGYAFDDLVTRMAAIHPAVPGLVAPGYEGLATPSVLELFWYDRQEYCIGIKLFGGAARIEWLFREVVTYLAQYGLVAIEDVTIGNLSTERAKITSIGQRFLSRLDRESKLREKVIWSPVLRNGKVLE